MAVTYNVAVKTARMTETRDYFADGTLEIQTSADAVLATFALTAAGGTIDTDTWTLAFDASTVTASATGTAAKAVIKNSAAAAHLTGLTVGITSSFDINLDSVSFTSGQDVTLSSATIQHA